MIATNDGICLNGLSQLQCGASSDLVITSEPVSGSTSASCECPGLPNSLSVSIHPKLRCCQARSSFLFSPRLCLTQVQHPSHAWYGKLNRLGCLSACCSTYTRVRVWALLCFCFTQSRYLAFCSGLTLASNEVPCSCSLSHIHLSLAGWERESKKDKTCEMR